MATTALKITKIDGTEERMLFMTAPGKDGFLDVDIFRADEYYLPFGGTSIGVSQTRATEEEYHKKLREEAHTKGHFVGAFSTDPEWNPVDYLPEIIPDEE